MQLILAQSPEAQIDIGAIYQEVLARAPDGGGLTTFMAALAGGEPHWGARHSRIRTDRDLIMPGVWGTR